MRKRGPPKKPTEIAKMQGNPGKRPLPEGEPLPKKVMPERPYCCGKYGNELWARLAPKLFDLGLLTEIDDVQFAIHCESYDQYRKCVNLITKHGALTEGSKGQSVKNPAFELRNDCFNQLKQLAQQFGLTPSARAGLNVGSQGEGDDPLSQILAMHDAGIQIVMEGKTA